MKLWGKAFVWIGVMLAIGYVVFTFCEVLK